jgi:hypothetical protein
MSSVRRPKREYPRAQHEGPPVAPLDSPNGECPSVQHESGPESRAERGVERIERGGELLALIVRNEYCRPGVSFFTPGELSQQLAYMCHPAGKVIAPHVHNPVPRQIAYTQETLVIKRGRLRVDFYDDGGKRCDSCELRAGDVLLLVKGGHGFEVLEDIEMIEVKQGPYAGASDKTLLAARVGTER